MRKLAVLMLGMSLIVGTATVFAQETKEEPKKEEKKKKSKKKKSEKKEEPKPGA